VGGNRAAPGPSARCRKPGAVSRPVSGTSRRARRLQGATACCQPLPLRQRLAHHVNAGPRCAGMAGRAMSVERNNQEGSVTPLEPVPSDRVKGPPQALLERIANGDNPILASREVRGLSQTDLACRSGIAQPTISKLERNVHAGTIKSIRALATVLAFRSTC
jgi:DNA-binding XRE family transcriptional regulator